MTLKIKNYAHSLLINSIAFLFLNLVIVLVAGAQEVTTAALTVGVRDGTLYGRNYGEDNTTDQMDVVFTPEADKDYLFSWQAYDIETDEMELFLNDQSIQIIPTTDDETIGDVDQITIPSTNLLSGENIFSFRVIGGDETWGVTNLFVEEIAPPPPSCTYPCPSPSSGAPLYTTDGDVVAQFNGGFGNAYGQFRTYNLAFPLLFTATDVNETNYNSTAVARDVVVRFTEKRALGNQSAIYSHFTNIFMNGELIEHIPASFGEQQKEVTLSRNLFNAGQNVIKITNQSFHNININPGVYIWGVKDVQMEYLPKIPLQRNHEKAVEYGSTQTPAYLTGLRAVIELATTNNVRLSLNAWDMDIVDELEVYVNGKSYGFLAQSANDQYNSGDTISLNSEDLIKGENHIELVLRRPGSDWDGTEDEQWRIKDIKISGSPTMAPIIMLLLND